jgi:hypothetical protein
MDHDLMTQASMAAFKGIVLALSNRSLLKSLAVLTYFLLFAAITMMQPLTAKAAR